MSNKETEPKQVAGRLQELERRLVALGNTVESLLADSVMVMIENGPGAPELRREDCLAHEHCLEIEKLCVELMTDGELSAEQARYVWAALKMATHMKRAADESLRIGKGLGHCGPDALASATSLAAVPHMAQMTQVLFSDAIDALANHDTAESDGVHLDLRELTSLGREAAEGFAQAMTAGTMGAATGIALVAVTEALERIGDEALGIANQVGHLYRGNGPEAP